MSSTHGSRAGASAAVFLACVNELGTNTDYREFWTEIEAYKTMRAKAIQMQQDAEAQRVKAMEEAEKKAAAETEQQQQQQQQMLDAQRQGDASARSGKEKKKKRLKTKMKVKLPRPSQEIQGLSQQGQKEQQQQQQQQQQDEGEESERDEDEEGDVQQESNNNNTNENNRDNDNNNNAEEEENKQFNNNSDNNNNNDNNNSDNNNNNNNNNNSDNNNANNGKRTSGSSVQGGVTFDESSERIDVESMMARLLWENRRAAYQQQRRAIHKAKKHFPLSAANDLCTLGFLQRKVGQFEQSMGSLNAALQADREHAEALWQRFALHRIMGNDVQAANDLTSLIRIKRSYKAYRARADMLAEKVGEWGFQTLVNRIVSGSLFFDPVFLFLFFSNQNFSFRRRTLSLPWFNTILRLSFLIATRMRFMLVLWLM